MTFSDLGQGFHLVPVRDHCRSLSDPTRPTMRDHMALESLLTWGDVPKGWTREEAEAVRSYWWNYQRNGARNAAYESFMAKRLKQRAECRAKRRATIAKRKRECALFICDPMAVQASRILRDVLADLRDDNAETAAAWSAMGRADLIPSPHL